MTTALRDVRFKKPVSTGLGLEVLSLRELALRIPPEKATPERPDFFVLVFIRKGAGKHMVDFHLYDTYPGCVVFVRPGQVQRWLFSDEQRGQVLLMTKEAVEPSVSRAARDMKLVALEEWATVSSLYEDMKTELFDAVNRLQQDLVRHGSEDISAAMIQHEMLALLLRILISSDVARGAEQSTAQNAVYRLFRKELEKRFPERVTSSMMARRLGYSEKTLSRACLAATGQNMKVLIDERVALEAKRLLAHSELSVHDITYQLGFSEPTNFVKFFRRVTGTTPLMFRNKSRPDDIHGVHGL